MPKFKTLSPFAALLLPFACQGAATQQPRVEPSAPAPRPEEDTCGCASMAVAYQMGQTSATYCSADGVPANIPGCEAVQGGDCDGGETAFQCPLGPYDPGTTNALGLSFQVTATLAGGSVPASCSAGQINQVTARSGGAPVPPPEALEAPTGPISLTNSAGAHFTFQVNVAPAAVPGYDFSGLTFGADGYTAPSELQRFDADAIRWLDSPSVSVDADENALERSNFIAYVKGSAADQGDCWCQFVYQNRWQQGQAAFQLVPVQGNNCSLLPARTAALESDPFPE